VIHSHVGEDLGHLDGVEYIGLASLAVLAVVGGRADFEGPQHDGYAGWFKVGI
jgi:hypothetical protein